MKWKTYKEPVSYQDAVNSMEKTVAGIINGDIDEQVWFLEHPSLYTAGTSAKENDLLIKDEIPVFSSGRGGQYTYHGPGQRIVYMMLDLRKRYEKPDLKKFIWDLEEVVIRSLRTLEIESFRREGRVGIWTYDLQNKESKIAAIGIRVRKWVGFHGISININPDLSFYEGIVPCGIKEYGVTSLANLGVDLSSKELDHIIKQEIKNIFSNNKET